MADNDAKGASNRLKTAVDAKPFLNFIKTGLTGKTSKAAVNATGGNCFFIKAKFQ